MLLLADDVIGSGLLSRGGCIGEEMVTRSCDTGFVLDFELSNEITAATGDCICAVC